MLTRLINWDTGHRGDKTEEIINYTNDYLLKHNLALINKIPTPIKVLKREGNKIVDGFFEEKGLLDYIGVCQGLPVAFDAKETKQKSLPLSNIAEHQYEYIENFIKQDGYAFIICNFKTLKKFYLIPGEIVLNYYYKSLTGDRKSIPENKLDKEYLIKFNEQTGILNFLPQLNHYYNQKKKNLLKLPLF